MTPPDELPDDLADHATERLLAAVGPEREREFEALLAAHPAHTAALRRLRAELAGAEGLLAESFGPGPTEPATLLGGHRVIRVLGEGAFGIVHLCAQTQPIVRQVAVKVLRPGVGDQKTLRRFAAERQLLAALNHPAIAQVFDAGVLPDGRPFFVMEFIDGQPIRDYCESRRLPCAARLRLFLDLCRGVAHAHKRGIVHRDLKPANVLVVDGDHGAQPKIIDFGIAKALFPSDDDAPRTDAGRVIGTPGYMSPEQAAGHSEAIDERADVFALGVMLYELLTGELPWARGSSATDTEPVRPSARIGTRPAHGADLPAQRQLASALRGDLDWITLAALARERDERYPSVARLIDDLECHLRGEPVSVGPPSLRYRLRKFVRRHRVVVATCAGAVVVLGIGAAVAIHYGRAAKAETTAARRAANDSWANATAVVERLLKRAEDPTLRDAPRGDVARQALLNDARSFYEQFLRERPDEPELRAGHVRALLALSQVHLTLGEFSRAAEFAAEAAREAGAQVAQAAEALPWRAMLGESLRRQGRALALASNHAGARPLLEAAKQHLAQCAAANPREYARAYSAVLREAADTCDEAHQAEELAGKQASLRVLDELRRDHADLAGLADDQLQACLAVATEFTSTRQFDEATAMLARAEALLPELPADRDRHLTMLRRQQSRVLWEGGDRPGAVRRLEESVAAAVAWQATQPRAVQPRESLLRSLRDLGTCQNYVGAFDESSTAFRRAIATAEAMVEQFPEDPSRRISLCRVVREFAHVLWDRFRREDLPEAAALATRAIAVNETIAPSVDVGRQPMWLLLADRAGIAEAVGPAPSDDWRDVSAAMPPNDDDLSTDLRNQLALAACGVARWQVRTGDRAGAECSLQLARAAIAHCRPVADKLLVDVGWLEAQLAAAAGDVAATAAAADRILAARKTWFAHRSAGECLFLAWRVGQRNGVDAERLHDFHRRAAEHFATVGASLAADVAKAPLDPWYVLPWGFASLRAAELAAAADEPERARTLLAAALPKLEAVRALAHADQWDEAIVAEAVALQQRLAAAAGR